MILFLVAGLLAAPISEQGQIAAALPTSQSVQAQAAQEQSTPEKSNLASDVSSQNLTAQCRGTNGYSEDFGGRRTFLWRPKWVTFLKTSPAAQSNILSAARKALENPPYSVTEKTSLVPGATRNDYISTGPYWWPDPKKKSGLPYVRRDGERNPEVDGAAFDKRRLSRFSRDVKALATAYYLTNDERYARHAAQMLRTWFIDPATRMNPNMNFAQGIPGKVYGRGIGIIEASHFSIIIESIGLLQPSPAISAAEHRAIQSWYREFALWMATSDNGIDELNKNNNHGVFYDFYLAHFALYTGMDNVTISLVKSFPESRLAPQMDRKGRFVAELKRTRSWHYSHFILVGAGKLATISECVGGNLWQDALPDQRSLMTAQSFLAPYWASETPWPFKDIELPKKQDRAGDFKSVLTVQKLFGYEPPADATYKDKFDALLP